MTSIDVDESALVAALATSGSPTLEAVEQIDKDLHRAGRKELGVADEDATAHRTALRRLLFAWCILSEPHGWHYCQAMSLIGAGLLVSTAHNVEEAFVLFVRLMNSLPARFFDERLEGARVEVRALRILATQSAAPLMTQLPTEPLDMVASQWFQTLFAGFLPLPCCLALWKRMATGVSIRPAAVDAVGGDGGAPPTTLALGAALALLNLVRAELEEAAAEDAAEPDDGGGCASYAVLQGAPALAPSADAFIDTALAASPSAAAAEAARCAARATLEAEEAADRERKACERARRASR